MKIYDCIFAIQYYFTSNSYIKQISAMKTNQQHSWLLPESKRTKIEQLRYQQSTSANVVQFNFPSRLCVYSEPYAKVQKPFSQNVLGMIDFVNNEAKQEVISLRITYHLDRRFVEDEQTIPSKFILRCSGFTRRCRGRLVYEFDQVDRCYYLRNCILKHHHEEEFKDKDIDKAEDKMRSSQTQYRNPFKIHKEQRINKSKQILSQQYKQKYRKRQKQKRRKLKKQKLLSKPWKYQYCDQQQNEGKKGKKRIQKHYQAKQTKLDNESNQDQKPKRKKQSYQIQQEEQEVEVQNQLDQYGFQQQKIDRITYNLHEVDESQQLLNYQFQDQI